MTTATAKNHDVTIAYEVLGPSTGEPMLLILGVGTQLIAWPAGFCDALVAAGFQIARFDNRDVGLSSHLTSAGRPSKLKLTLSPASAAPYGLVDLVADALAVLDDLGWQSAHVVGFSQGGMVAQKLATDHPDRVKTLTSISSTPSPKIGRMKVKALMSLLRIAKRPISSPDDNAQHFVDLQPLIGSPDYPFDETETRALGRLTFVRGHDQAGVERQSAAFQGSGDRRGELARLRMPTLVVHGEADQMIRLPGGQATADAIQGARLVTFPGMGHELPRELWPQIIAEIVKVAGPRPQVSEEEATGGLHDLQSSE